MKRVFLMVLDSVGIGEMPDAAQYGDAGSNTLAAASTSSYFSMPNMQKLGLFNMIFGSIEASFKAFVYRVSIFFLSLNSSTL